MLDVVPAASARLSSSSVLDAVGAQPDAGYAALPGELRDALTVGRPIAGEADDGATVPAVDRISALYDAINARDVEAVVARFAPDVDWPETMQGGRVVGRDAVREHWLQQWEVVDLQMRPRRVRELPDGRVEVLVEVVARDRDGDLLGGGSVLHTYTLRGDLVTRMDVGDPQG